jgi:prepilin-type N-terminal cleavage/methylation domain-containing protein/prepilin-type processing-associated H-X9-DG protein
VKRRGFTLIELLVVIAIIAILAAILFPVFAKARDKARQSSCLSNIKQLTIAMLSYAQDFDETIPKYRLGSTNPSCSTMWYTVLPPYIKSTQIFHCPSVTYGTDADISYGCNGTHASMCNNGPGLALNDGLTLSDIKNAAQCFIIFDAAADGYCVGTSYGPKGGKEDRVFVDGYCPVGGGGCGNFTNPAANSKRHNNGANGGFLDGHAKWYNSLAWNNVNAGPNADLWGHYN